MPRPPRHRGDEPHEITRRVAKNLRDLREDKGWSQEEAAFRSQVHTRLLQKIEDAEIDTRLTTLARLAAGLELDIRRLLAPQRRRARTKPR